LGRLTWPHNSCLLSLPSLPILYEGIRDKGLPVRELLTQYASEIGSFVAGAVSGAAGALITLRIKGRNQVMGSGSITDQSRSVAGGDIVGRDKKVSGGQRR
jgi:hypothetical protein